MEYTVEFHGTLVFFTGSAKEKHILSRTAPMKDIVEALGVPHTEIGMITSLGTAKDLWYIPEDKDWIHVYPVEPPLNVTIPTLLRPDPFPRVRFVADVNVGKLAKLMRLLGFDTAYENGWSDPDIAERAFKEQRIVLTKDRDLLKRKIISYGRLVRSIKPWDQLAEIVHFFGLEKRISPFRICTLCNRTLVRVRKEEVIQELEPLTRIFFNEFTRCPGCGKVYWAGTHHERILEGIRSLEKGSHLQAD